MRRPTPGLQDQELAGLDRPAPDFRTLSRRQKALAVNIPHRGPRGPLHPLIGSVTADSACDTAFPHAMHLHGCHFREIAFVADTPGDWLFPCHMLSPAAAGMTTWLRVAAGAR